MKVNFFATLRDIAGGKTVEFDVVHGVTAQELLDKIIERFPMMKRELLNENGEMYGHVPFSSTGAMCNLRTINSRRRSCRGIRSMSSRRWEGGKSPPEAVS